MLIALLVSIQFLKRISGGEELRHINNHSGKSLYQPKPAISVYIFSFAISLHTPLLLNKVTFTYRKVL